MCYQCWQEQGAHQIDNPRVRAAAAAIEEVYEFSSVGGNLHIYLDDFNLDLLEGDNALKSIDDNHHEADPEQIQAETRCAHLLLALSEEERVSALGIQWGFWGRDENQKSPGPPPS